MTTKNGIFFSFYFWGMLEFIYAIFIWLKITELLNKKYIKINFLSILVKCFKQITHIYVWNYKLKTFFFFNT